MSSANPTPPPLPGTYTNVWYALILAVFVGFLLYLGLTVTAANGGSLSQWQTYVSVVLAAITSAVGGFLIKVNETNKKNKKASKENKETLETISTKIDTNLELNTTSEAQITFLITEMSVLRASNRALEAKLINAAKQIAETSEEIQKLRQENFELRELVTKQMNN